MFLGLIVLEWVWITSVNLGKHNSIRSRVQQVNPSIRHARSGNKGDGYHDYDQLVLANTAVIMHKFRLNANIPLRQLDCWTTETLFSFVPPTPCLARDVWAADTICLLMSVSPWCLHETDLLHTVNKKAYGLFFTGWKYPYFLVQTLLNLVL